MLSVDEIARQIVRREGGFVNDPDDPGGPTKHGVTLITMERLGLDLNKDGQIDTQDVKALTVEQAADIFTKHYFYEPGIDQLPQVLQHFSLQPQRFSSILRIKIYKKRTIWCPTK